MKQLKGYYCLLQYCPDLARLEAANIGVLLFCPEWPSLRARTVRGNKRIQRFCGRADHDWARIESSKTAIEERLAVEARRLVRRRHPRAVDGDHVVYEDVAARPGESHADLR